MPITFFLNFIFPVFEKTSTFMTERAWAYESMRASRRQQAPVVEHRLKSRGCSCCSMRSKESQESDFGQLREFAFLLETVSLFSHYLHRTRQIIT